MLPVVSPRGLLCTGEPFGPGPARTHSPLSPGFLDVRPGTGTTQRPGNPDYTEARMWAGRGNGFVCSPAPGAAAFPSGMVRANHRPACPAPPMVGLLLGPGSLPRNRPAQRPQGFICCRPGLPSTGELYLPISPAPLSSVFHLHLCYVLGRTEPWARGGPLVPRLPFFSLSEQ